MNKKKLLEANNLYIKKIRKLHREIENANIRIQTMNNLDKELVELKGMGLKATSLIAHLKDQYGFNEVEQKTFDEIIEVFGYKDVW